MADTTNKGLEKPAYNDYAANPTGWTDAVNTNWDEIDASLGNTTSLNATSASGTVALTVAQYRSLILNVSGTLTANVAYQIPTGVGGQWIVVNGTTGSFDLSVSSGGGGDSVICPQGQTVIVCSDGTDIRFAVDSSIAANSVTNAMLAQIATQTIKGRNTAATGNVEDITATQVLDWLYSTQGGMLFRNSTVWTGLAPGTAGFFLSSGGAGADLSWANPNTALPSQTGNSGKQLTTDGTNASWSAASQVFARCTVTNGTAATCSGAGIVNVTSITQVGAVYTITFTTAAADANYQVLPVVTSQGASLRTVLRTVTKSLGSFTLTFGPGNVVGVELCPSFDFVVYPSP